MSQSSPDRPDLVAEKLDRIIELLEMILEKVIELIAAVRLKKENAP